jgi:hypothetical protein
MGGAITEGQKIDAEILRPKSFSKGFEDIDHQREEYRRLS